MIEEIQSTVTSISKESFNLDKLIQVNVATIQNHGLKITEIVKQYSHLKIIDFNDDAGYAKILDARKQLQKARIDLENTRKEFVEGTNKYNKAINSAAKEYKESAQKVEENFDTEIDAYEKYWEEQRVAAQNAKLAAIETRKQNLYDIGMTFNGIAFIYKNEFHIDLLQIQTVSQEEFENLIAPIKTMSDFDKALAEAEKVEAANKAAALKLQQEEEEKERILQQEKLAQELKDRQAALDIKEQQLKDKEEQLTKQNEVLIAKTYTPPVVNTPQFTPLPQHVSGNSPEFEAEDKKMFTQYLQGLSTVPRPVFKTTKYRQKMQQLILLLTSLNN